MTVEARAKRRKRKMVDAETVALKRRKRASGTIEEERGMEVWDRRERETERERERGRKTQRKGARQKRRSRETRVN